MKTKTVYYCQKCGSQHPKWSGQCGDCGAWNTLVEEAYTRSAKAPVLEDIAVKTLSEIDITQEPRLSTGSEELDRVLGGGLVMGSVVLIGGNPGIGKSTLLIEVLAKLPVKSLYITGEESLQQVSLRARRLNLPEVNLRLLADTHVERIIQISKTEKPRVMVVDSIQTMFTDSLESAPGSVSQVREAAAKLLAFAKTSHTSLFLVGHVTKEGTLAGPRVLEHMVDCVLYFEGEKDNRFRLIRAFKNRFGAVNELGIFAMTDKGLKDVHNPSAIFLSRYPEPVSGSVAMVTWEGSRPLLVEIQALVDESHLANPRRVCVGLEQNRLAMLLAALHRHAGVQNYNQDVFVNVVGGVRVTETGADLAILLSILSSLKNKPLPLDLIVFGEVGLGGEIRPVQGGQERLKEAAKHGFKQAIIPEGNTPKKPIDGMKVTGVKHLSGVMAVLREL